MINESLEFTYQHTKMLYPVKTNTHIIVLLFLGPWKSLLCA